MPPSIPIILVVDDEALVRFATVSLAEDAGYEVLEAANAAEAILLMERRRDISVIVTDINMPGTMDGLQLAYYVRDRWPPVHLLVVSGRPLRTNLPPLARFLDKPFTRGQLAAELSHFLT